MRKCLLMLVLAVAINGTLYSARVKYSLPSSCSLSDGMQSYTADRLDLYAIQNETGSVESPFQIVGYDGKGEIKFNFVFKKQCVEVCAPLLSPDLKSDVVRNEVISDGFRIEDSFLRFTVNVADGLYHAVVRDLDEERLMARVEADAAGDRAALAAGSKTSWPEMDSKYKYCSSREEGKPIITRGKGNGESVVGLLRTKCALYQQEEKFLIRFVFSHESTNGVTIARSEGRVVGELVNGEIKNTEVIYDVGKDIVNAQIGIAKAAESTLPHSKELSMLLEERGIETCTIRLALAYGEYLQELDLDMEQKRVVDKTVVK